MPPRALSSRISFRCLVGPVLALILIAGVGVVWSYVNNQFWTHLDTRDFTSIVEYRSGYVRGFRGRQILVHKSFVGALETLDSYARQSGVRLIVTSSLRRHGEEPRGTIVSPAEASNHQAGHAVDVNIRVGSSLFKSDSLERERLASLPPPVRDFIQLVRANGSLRWGGDFQPSDPVHIDDGLNRRNSTQWEEHKDESQADLKNARRRWRLW